MSADRKIQLKNSACEIIDYFSSKNVEAYIIDSTGKADFELFESQRIYIERVNYSTLDYFWVMYCICLQEGRPYNYLVEEETLVKEHEEFYKGINLKKEEEKRIKKEEYLFII